MVFKKTKEAKHLTLLLLSCLLSFWSFAKAGWEKVAEDPEFLHRSVKTITDVIVHDIYSPPVASRIYAYVTIAGYEAACQMDRNYLSFAGQLHGLQSLPQLDSGVNYCFSLSSVHALLTVAESMIISEEKVAEFHSKILQEYKQTGMPLNVFESSIAYGKKVADAVILWAAKDNYKESRSLPKYPVGNDATTWKPTPPSYMKAIEPNWSKLRTFIIDSAQQFKPVHPPKFSTDKNSAFYKEAIAVQNAGLSLTEKQIEIANFWDCNPFKMNVNGHVMFATKKISPGGHWINITRLACEKTNARFIQSAEAYACLSITLADAFISCWDEKYRSKVIRPETYINQYISQSWVPLLQTPPFPEYTSGHSVISTASAIILTKLFGENFFYSDSTEVEFKLPVRDFKSFKQAAEEAAISRFYGGIHYISSIINGAKEGEQIGLFITKKMKTTK